MESYKITGLTYKTEYTFTVKSEDSSAAAECTLTVSSAPAILISTEADLETVRSALDGCYILTSDITLTSEWVPFGEFTGTFDGNGHVISGFTNNPAGAGFGFFGGISVTGVLKNLKVSGVINYDIFENDFFINGGITKINNGTISNCISNVSLTIGNGKTSFIGGLVGWNRGSINNCYATGTVTNNGMDDSGGLAGVNSGTIYYCYANGTVSGITNTGGLAGNNSGMIYYCYANGAVTGSSYTGGLLGTGTGAIISCYASGAVSGSSNTGGLAGSFTGVIVSCYYDGDTTGYYTANSGSLIWTIKGTTCTTQQMKTRSTYISEPPFGWLFAGDSGVETDDTWSIDPAGVINSGYPYLTGLEP